MLFLNRKQLTKPKLDHCHEILGMNILCQKWNVDVVKLALVRSLKLRIIFVYRLSMN
jgi:hypothetical protein